MMNFSRLLFTFFIVLNELGFSLAQAETGTITVHGAVASSGCSVSGATDVDIGLGDVHDTDLPSVGSTWGQSAEYDITLSCSAGARVTISFAGDNDPDYGDNTVLKNTGTASGVSTQLIDLNGGANSPIAMGSSWTVTSSSGASETIPLAARYIRTGTVGVGTVLSSATYTMNYE